MRDFEPVMSDLSHIDFRNNLNSPAELFFESMKEIIERYDKQTDDQHQVVWKVACVNGKEYPVFEIGYINPSLMRFKSREADGGTCELLIHVASVQFVIHVVQLKPDEPKRNIGFQRD